MTVFDDLLKVLQLGDGGYDLEKIKSAYALAADAHAGQFRDSGEPFVSHPVAVALILAGLGMDSDTLVAALLHDTVEDTDMTLEEVAARFGDDTAQLVDGVTKLRRLPFSSREEEQAENIRKMLMVTARDVRVTIIKLADRLHNMRTIGVRPPQNRRDNALETMEIYAPIAHRLGIHTIKEELEELSLRYLDPVGYAEIENQLNMKAEERKQFLERIKAKITARLSEKFDDVFIEGRVKGIYGIYRKLYMQDRTMEEIYDIYAIRVIVDTVDECYQVFGEMQDMFNPIPSRFKDYISNPKANMYQSLHTTVFDKEASATPFEVQIRTWEMHQTAEFGVASHWRYKAAAEADGTRINIKSDAALEKKISWVRQFLEAQKDSVDSREILGAIKSDLATDEVFVYTPKGDVITLPAGSTVVDFAYSIHSEIGSRMNGAKIDGRMVSLDTQLQTGNIVNILIANDESRGPSRDWLTFVKTSSARNKIRQWFKRERLEENIEAGQSDLLKEMRRYNILLEDEELELFTEKFARSRRFHSSREFLAAIGYGGISLTNIMPALREAYRRQYDRPDEEQIKRQLLRTSAQKPRKASAGVIVEGLEGCKVNYAKCCGPLPGDDIVGYVTRGSGVSVHKRDCVNADLTIGEPNQKERWVNCQWAKGAAAEKFKSTVDVIGKDRPGLLLDVSILLNNMHLAVSSIIAREYGEDMTAIQITFGVSDLEQLHHVSGALKKVSGISRVERVTQ
ncbi:MAG: bifunctional (p)ppGpp synthetase/guanosine-3',5'-bis(diphosphate) 3'-pyrophosphohydrolase [Oscillospiraceae bacterium]|nr:bifunctional (p)ppGpp synthetase/guanosine-3',5'-bis(diphosphate) 3'-pyrophosphohydrolase [Oscillospiraceae bacterium]